MPDHLGRSALPEIDPNEEARFPLGNPFHPFIWDPYVFTDARQIDRLALRALKSRFSADAKALYQMTRFKDGDAPCCGGPSTKPHQREVDKLILDTPSLSLADARQSVYTGLEDDELNPYDLRAMFEVRRGSAMVGGFMMYNGTPFGRGGWSVMLGATFDVETDQDGYYDRVASFISWLFDNPLIQHNDSGPDEFVQISQIRFPQTDPTQQWSAPQYVGQFGSKRNIRLTTVASNDPASGLILHEATRNGA